MPNLSLHEIILLDKVSKSKSMTEFEIKELKDKQLIEGRKPNFHISAEVAINSDEKEKYIKNRGFKDEHYKKMILDYIRQYDFATKTNIDHLVLDILPAVLDEKQKANKVRNLIYALSKRDKYIENQGTVRYPKWALTSSKLQNQDEL
jgi:ATP-dependent DNA helicase RecG